MSIVLNPLKGADFCKQKPKNPVWKASLDHGQVGRIPRRLGAAIMRAEAA
jgi:hypothetical protein